MSPVREMSLMLNLSSLAAVSRIHRRRHYRAEQQTLNNESVDGCSGHHRLSCHCRRESFCKTHAGKTTGSVPKSEWKDQEKLNVALAAFALSKIQRLDVTHSDTMSHLGRRTR